MFEKEYFTPGEVSRLTVQEKAERHLKTWSKKRLIVQLLNSAKSGWLEKWADEYDETQKGTT